MLADKCLNEEQKLMLALYAASSIKDENDPVRWCADHFLIAYVVEKYGGDGISVEEIQEKYKTMIVDFLLNRLVSKGVVEPLINEDGQVEYRMNENVDINDFGRCD